MHYNHKLDLQIISQIEKEGGRLTFNKLKYKIGTNGLTLSRHLENLEKQEIIIRSSSPDNSPGGNNELFNERPIGKERYCYLTEVVKFERELGIFRGVKSKREERNKSGSRGRNKERRRLRQLLLSHEEKTYRLWQLLLLLVAQTGALRYTKMSVGEEKPGDIFGYDPKEKRHFTYRISILPGFGESDFYADTISNVTHYRGVFGYLSLTEKERKDFFKRLKSFNPPIIKQIEDEHGKYKEARYILADKRLEQLLSKIWELFHYVYEALEAKWNYCRQPTIEEYEWYRMFYSDPKTRFLFTYHFKEKYFQSHDDRQFSSLGPQWVSLLKKDFQKEQEGRYSKNCENAKEKKEEIEQKYHDILDRYSSPYSLTIKAMIDEIYSPLGSEKNCT
jgi:hypothetical protein